MRITTLQASHPQLTLDRLTAAEQRELEQRMQRKQMGQFMNVRLPNPSLLHQLTTTDVLQSRTKLLRALRRRLHIQEPVRQRRRLRHALRGQVPQGIGEVGAEVPGAECGYGAEWEYDA